MNEIIWYEYEANRPGKDWISTPLHAETLEDLKKLDRWRIAREDETRPYGLRIVKKTITTEVIEVIK